MGIGAVGVDDPDRLVAAGDADVGDLLRIGRPVAQERVAARGDLDDRRTVGIGGVDLAAAGILAVREQDPTVAGDGSVRYRRRGRAERWSGVRPETEQEN